MQDVVTAFAITVREDIARLEELVSLFREMNPAAIAIGTDINTNSDYTCILMEELLRLTRLPRARGRKFTFPEIHQGPRGPDKAFVLKLRKSDGIERAHARVLAAHGPAVIWLRPKQAST